jgi:membrane-bound lytic murein transglycosylase D
MLKRLGVFCFLALLFSSYSRAEAGLDHQLVSDTADIQTKDSSKKDTLSDPKAGFKDMFVTAEPLLNGVSFEQLNPLAISFVEDYMSKHSKSMNAMKDWGRAYFDMMDGILTKHGLPKELKYLAVIESQLKSHATSWAGAVGPWQFMPSTARKLGLKVGGKVDERRDIFKSTHAACRYLTNLYSIYGDWLLVIAAYNGGPGKVNAAIKRSGSRDFWTLQKYLPAESRKHVKKFIATHYIMEGSGGVTTLTKIEAKNFLTNATAVSNGEVGNSVSQVITGRYNSSIIVKHVAMDLLAFNRINPNFDADIAFNGKYELRLPAEKMDIFITKKSDILNESIMLLLNGDTAISGTR